MRRQLAQDGKQSCAYRRIDRQLLMSPAIPVSIVFQIMILSALSVGDIRQFIYPAKHVYNSETEKNDSQGISPFRIIGIGIGIAIGIGIDASDALSIPIPIPIAIPIAMGYENKGWFKTC